MNIFVTGIVGSIGVHTVRSLTHRSYEVVVRDAAWTWYNIQLVDTKERCA